jgi:hypothetical protein
MALLDKVDKTKEELLKEHLKRLEELHKKARGK